MMELSDDENERAPNNFDSDHGNRSDEAEEEPATGKEDNEETKRRIDPSTSKKKIVRNPVPKLNAERIQGPKGIQTIEKSFEDFKFQGKGHEKSDLNGVMKRLEYWAHRLFPKYCFDDFIEKMETLGTKKNIQVFLKKYRLGMVDTDYDRITENGIEDDVERGDEVTESKPIDKFDKLIAEQIEKQRAMDKTLDAPKPSAGNVLGTASAVKPSELSDEIKARIEANKKLALERKMARAKRLEEEKEKQRLEEAQKDSEMVVTQARIEQEVSMNTKTNREELSNDTEMNVQTSANDRTTNINNSLNTEVNVETQPNDEETNIETLSNTIITNPDILLEKNEASEDLEMVKKKRLKLDNFSKDFHADHPNPSTLVNDKLRPMEQADTTHDIDVNQPDGIEAMILDSEAPMSHAEETSKEVQVQLEDSLPELEEVIQHPMEKETQKTPNGPHCNNSFPEQQNGMDIENDSDKLLTEEELLRAIDGAMEEIIEDRNIVL